jgi:hypothetical protein
MLTVLDNLRIWAEDIIDLLKKLLQGSSVKAGGWMGFDVWDELDDSSRQVQSRILEEYRRFSSTLEFFLNKQPENTIKNFQESKKIILSVIQQDGEENTLFGNCDLAFSEAEKARHWFSLIVGLKTLPDKGLTENTKLKEFFPS